MSVESIVAVCSLAVTLIGIIVVAANRLSKMEVAFEQEKERLRSLESQLVQINLSLTTINKSLERLETSYEWIKNVTDRHEDLLRD